MNTARKLYRITHNAIMRELSRRWGFQTIGTGEYLFLDAATHYTMNRDEAQQWASCYPSAIIVSRGNVVASFLPAMEG
jgi:hypothetical protein